LQHCSEKHHTSLYQLNTPKHTASSHPQKTPKIVQPNRNRLTQSTRITTSIAHQNHQKEGIDRPTICGVPRQPSDENLPANQTQPIRPLNRDPVNSGGERGPGVHTPGCHRHRRRRRRRRAPWFSSLPSPWPR
jgi:hypothetical protein